MHLSKFFKKLNFSKRIASIIKEEVEEDKEPEPSSPEIIMHLEDSQVDEGEMAKFLVKITGYPKPRVNWFLNKTHCVSVSFLLSIEIDDIFKYILLKGSRFKLYFDGMIHYLDIPKTSKNDEGIIRCIAKNQSGEVETKAKLRINPKADFRSVLRNVKTGEPIKIEEESFRERGELKNKLLKG